ncbi:MAG: iron ABC transporter permease [Acinetobacter sp.]
MKAAFSWAGSNPAWKSWLILGAAAFALMLASLMYGEIRLSFHQLWAAMLSQAQPADQLLLEKIRLPRLLAGMLIGGALALSGLLLQLVTKNALASPDVFGISDSAVLALAFTILFSSSPVLGQWWHALFGALACVSIILLAAGGIGTQGYRILVIGIGVATLMKASFDLILSTLPVMHSSSILVFSTGSLIGRSYTILLPASLLILALLSVILLWRRFFSVVVLPDAVIQSIGTSLPSLRFIMICIAAFLAGTAVSIAGPIGFVAIAAPILSFKLFPQNLFPVFPALCIGALMVAAADLLGRTLLAPVEIPAGIISGMIGGPLLLWLLYSNSRNMSRI